MARSRGLRISPQLALPLEVVTSTLAILAVKRAGKSNAAVVMAEEMYDAGLPWVAIDPKGDWWGVRAAGDGNSPGLSVLVFGGLHGDVPLEPTSGRLVADLIVDQRITCVLDVSEMTKADQRRFLIDFATNLYRHNREPLHVFCEEADEYIPQRVMGEMAKVVGAFETLVKRGGFRGIGITLITQRSASLNKDVLTQIETLIPMRTPSPQDRKAILDWVNVHHSGKEVVDQLPSLTNGEAYVFSPQFLDQQLVKIKFRRRRTFDSGATPKIGEKVRPPARLAEVDLDSIRTAMAETIEKAEANDPKVLHKKIEVLERQYARLEKELEEAQRQQPEPVVETIEIPVIPESLMLGLKRVETEMRSRLRAIEGEVRRVTEEVADMIGESLKVDTTSAPPVSSSKPPVANRPSFTTRSLATEEKARQTAGPLKKVERAIVSVLVHSDRPMQSVANLAGYSIGGGFNNGISSLRTKGYIEGSRDRLSITDAGREALGPVDPLPTGADLREYWKSHKALPKPSRLLIDALADHYPEPQSIEHLAAITGYAIGGGFNNGVSRLRSLGLAHSPEPGTLVLDDTLMED